MNYYERHLGDYAKDTAHLSMLEHGAYSLLLDRYYSTEQGIPEDQAHRVARARSKEEKAAVDAVLQEFFTLSNGVWVNNRTEEEIEKARQRIEAAKANGKRGGRPKQKPDDNPSQTQEKPSGLLPGSKTETQTKALQTPDTSNQPPKKDSVPNGTGAGAPLTPRDELFALVGPAAEKFGTSDKATRSLFGQAVKEAGGQHAVVVEAVRHALRDPPLEFSAWLIGACKPKPQKLYGMELDDDERNAAGNSTGGDGADAAVLERATG